MKKILINKQDSFSKKLKKHNFIKPYIYNPNKWKINDIINTCKLNNIDIIFPLHFTSYKLINKNKNILKENKINYLIPELNIAKIFKYKNKFVKWMLNNNFENYIPKIYKTIQVPCIIKYFIGCDGHKINIIQREKDIKNYNLENYIIQEYIPGKTEYATHILFKDGVILCHQTNKYIFKNDNNVKTTQKKNFKIIKKQIEKNVLNIFLSILKCAEWNGFCCIDYKLINYNNILIPKIFEINERIGGSLVENSEELEPFIDKYLTVL